MTQPCRFFELVIQDAIIRPGANGSGETRSYIERPPGAAPRTPTFSLPTCTRRCRGR